MVSGSEKRPPRLRAVSGKYAVLGFRSTHDTILAESLATQRGCVAEVIPQPPGRTGRCGVALRIDAADLNELTEIFVRGGLAGFDVTQG